MHFIILICAFVLGKLSLICIQIKRLQVSQSTQKCYLKVSSANASTLASMDGNFRIVGGQLAKVGEFRGQVSKRIKYRPRLRNISKLIFN